MRTSVIRVTPRTTTIEARSRRATYLASIRSYIKPGGPSRASASRSFAVRDPDLVMPRPLRELVERSEVSSLDALVDAVDAGVEEDDRRRHLVGHDVLELFVELLALVLVQRRHSLVEDRVDLVVLEVRAVEAARRRVARVVERRLIRVGAPVEPDQEKVECPDADDLADELRELDEGRRGLDADVLPRLLHDLQH